jgi:hypothetical protein
MSASGVSSCFEWKPNAFTNRKTVGTSVGNKEPQANRRVVGLLETMVLKLADFFCFHAIVDP